jgi:RNA polymerase sigma-70 factor (ECF subfamily)
LGDWSLYISMAAVTVLERARLESWTDEEVVERVLSGETALFEIVMRRYNQRLYRVTRAILRDDAEAEDVIQDAYVRAYAHLRQFAARARFSTWLTRIAVHEALARLQRRRPMVPFEEGNDLANDSETSIPRISESPEQQTLNMEVGRLLENAVLCLPDKYREVLMLRDVEGMSTTEVADTLELTEENVKVRLYRARALIREDLYARLGSVAGNAFSFMGSRCDRVVLRVFELIG